ncbi:hypothetical protein [Streptobacillus canis]|nr:hypothetical protein [Streptobacillus canis]
MKNKKVEKNKKATTKITKKEILITLQIIKEILIIVTLIIAIA